ncbi:MAG: hypothetical protein IT445_00880 [Phycisphaeraceae bacterium]|nr:hypothetical protein [Phycisphaeraceae bacterium]
MKLQSIPVALSCMALAFASTSVSAYYVTTGTYDADPNLNDVDTSATFDGPNTMSLATFTSLVAIAYNGNYGGVIDFDNGSLTDGNTIDARYGISQANNITITDAAGTGNFTAPTTSPSTAISGSNANSALGRTTNNHAFSGNSFYFTFNPADQVVAVGATILSNLVIFGSGVGNVGGIARYNDSTSSGYTYSNVGNGNGADDTFWGFKAPAGKYITRFELSITNDVYVGLDDLGFILIPEPASLLLLSALAPALLSRRYHLGLGEHTGGRSLPTPRHKVHAMKQ